MLIIFTYFGRLQVFVDAIVEHFLARAPDLMNRERCPSLLAALQDLFNCCWSQSTVPSHWKLAAIKLIPKSSAKDDPTSPSNFRPIALTSCIGKLFTTILRNRWLTYMVENNFLDRSIQKVFMTATPGCVEHHCKLGAILAEAKKWHKSLAVCWLDLANAYGSVHHSLIQFSLQHYHALPKFCQTLQSLYTDLHLILGCFRGILCLW